MEGHSLGGSATPLSPEEMRRRRLAALQNGPPKPALKSPPPSTSTAAAVVKKTTTFVVDNDDDEDAELQAALALSLQTSDTKGSSSVNQEDDAVIDDEQAADDTALHSPSVIATWHASVTPVLIADFHSIMWDSALTTENDKLRWISQGIHVVETPLPSSPPAAAAAAAATATEEPETTWTMLEALAKSHEQWGLVQHHGGPCGVLAAVQAELLRLLLFGRRRTLSESLSTVIDYPQSPHILAPPEPLSKELIDHGLAKAIGLLIARATLTPSAAATARPERPHAHVVLIADATSTRPLDWEDLEPWTGTSSTGTSTRLSSYAIALPEPPSAVGPKRQKTKGEETLESRILRLARAVATFLSTPLQGQRPLDAYQRHGGVLLLVMSLVASRGKKYMEEEFDDAMGTKLTSQFGHCSQELINLLLTGQAVSNVFDNTLKPSGDMICRGIQAQPSVGYLSQLESLRYCEVGGYYKSPKFPIWVVGSTTHFTVLFGEASALQESQSDMLLEQCRRAFKTVEGGEENGFIVSDQLSTVFEALGLEIGGPSTVQTLAASLEVAGAGIILWDDFWKATSRLLTGATVETVLQGHSGDFDFDDEPPPLIKANELADSFAGPFHGPPTSSGAQSSSDLFGMISSTSSPPRSESTPPQFVDLYDEMAESSLVARAPSPMQVDPVVMSDEELARKLQAEWDAEIEVSSGSHAAVNGSPGPTLSDIDSRFLPPTPPPRNRIEEDSKPAAKDFSDPRAMEFEQYGNTFELYHYNGLRGGVLTPFRVTRLSAEEAVGTSIALNRNHASASSHSNGRSGDLEDVIRTKWPSCMLNWLGQSPPVID